MLLGFKREILKLIRLKNKFRTVSEQYSTKLVECQFDPLARGTQSISEKFYCKSLKTFVQRFCYGPGWSH